MPAAAPRRGGSQIVPASAVFVTQFTIASSRNPPRELHHATKLRALARGAVEEILDLVAVGARELELVPALEREEVLAIHVRPQAAHQAQIDHRRAVDALEELGIQDLLELLHRAAQDMSITA